MYPLVRGYFKVVPRSGQKLRGPIAGTHGQADIILLILLLHRYHIHLKTLFIVALWYSKLYYTFDFNKSNSLMVKINKLFRLHI